MFFKSSKNLINAQVIKVKTDKIAKRIMRDAKKRIKRGELLDSRSFGMYLNHIDAQYDHIKADADNTTMVADYTVVRNTRLAQTGQLLAFYDSSYDDLRRLYKNLAEKAAASGREDDLKNSLTRPPDMDDLRTAFKKLTNEREPVARQLVQKQPTRVRF